jgi:tRNA pseudouridine55 synthase
MDGFLIIDKPQGITSQKVVAKVRRALGLKKVGHTGTLDPLATGVLPLALGEATKVINFLDESIKVYQVKGRLGFSTDTYDADGRLDQAGDPSKITETILTHHLQGFLGKQDQFPPAYSAIKINGKPLYAYAREGNLIQAKSRPIIIHQIELDFFNNPNFEFRVTCSRGTYVRSIVHDLGKNLGCFSHVTKLRRLQSGSFTLDQALTLDSVLENPTHAKKQILTIEHCLSSLPQLNLDSEIELKRVVSGGQVGRVSERIEAEGWVGKTVALKYDDRVIALVKGGITGKICYQRVLNR